MERSSRPSVRPWVVLAILFTLGCSSCGERPGAEATSEDPSGVEAPTGESLGVTRGPVGTVRGVVRLAEGTEAPLFVPDQMGGSPNVAMPRDCTPPRIDDRRPVRPDDAGNLRNVVVTLTAEDRDGFFARMPEREPARHEVAIRDCRLDPPVLAVARGDVLVLSNETDYPFLPTSTTASRGFLRGLIKGEPQEMVIDQMGVTTLVCGMLAGCGRLDVVVASHPLNATTGEDGTFVIENVPAGMALRVHAWHPLFEESVADVRVEEGGEARVELTIRPAAAPPPAAPEPEDESGFF
ncbi:MAG: carboxypeptidase regulatory-like domain-containing protein [Myxococcales bacterium]|nr:carboxypeptidase regulatory-like domain-containing protein [Myxococcales bacterium]